MHKAFQSEQEIIVHCGSSHVLWSCIVEVEGVEIRTNAAISCHPVLWPLSGCENKRGSVTDNIKILSGSCCRPLTVPLRIAIRAETVGPDCDYRSGDDVQ